VSAAELVEQAEAIARNAYAPYSKYLVGAVVRTTDGRTFVGVNVENAAYPLGIMWSAAPQIRWTGAVTRWTRRARPRS